MHIYWLHPPAAALPESTVQHWPELPHVAQTDYVNVMLEEFGATEIETVDLTGDNFLNDLYSLMSRVSGQLWRLPSPSSSFLTLEGLIILSSFPPVSLRLCI
jgi:hypothetical protein